MAVPDVPVAPEDPEPRPPSPPEGDAPAIVVVLGEKVPIDPTDDLRRLVDRNPDRLDPLRDFLARNSAVRTARVVTAISLRELLDAEAEARDTDFPPVESLARYWRLDVTGLRGEKTPDQLVEELLAPERDRLQADRGVAHAYVESIAESPGGPGAIPVLTEASGQGWLRPGEEGVNAWAAWEHLGGHGNDIEIVDVEQGWKLTHPDVNGLVDPPLVHINRFDESGAEGSHGTSVLGLVMGRPNSVGGAGIARGATVRICSHYDGTEIMRTVDAVLIARKNLVAGDVLLLEVHLPHMNYMCAEADDATFHAIRLASAKGIVVVEAAGNGKADISAWASAAGRRLSREEMPKQDSGAIMVAACRSGVEVDAVSGTKGHGWNHQQLSNFGARVDCYSWGDGVQAPVVPQAPVIGDHGPFTRTSAAAAIIAGVVASVQGMRVAAGEPRLRTRAMRSLLRDTPGTKQVPSTSTFLIGVMPDLGALALAVGAVRAQLPTGSRTDIAVPVGPETSP